MEAKAQKERLQKAAWIQLINKCTLCTVNKIFARGQFLLPGEPLRRGGGVDIMPLGTKTSTAQNRGAKSKESLTGIVHFVILSLKTNTMGVPVVAQ